MILLGNDFAGSGTVRGHRRAHSGLAGVDGLGDVEVKVGSGWNADEDALTLHRVGDLLRVEVGGVLHALGTGLLETIVLRGDDRPVRGDNRLKPALGERLRKSGPELGQQHLNLCEIVRAYFLTTQTGRAIRQATAGVVRAGGVVESNAAKRKLNFAIVLRFPNDDPLVL